MMAPMLMFPLIAACAPSRAPTYSTIPLLGALAAPERALESTVHLQFWLPLSRALPTSRRLRMVSGPIWTQAREQARQEFPTAVADGVVRRRMMAPNEFPPGHTMRSAKLAGALVACPGRHPRQRPLAPTPPKPPTAETDSYC
jgi:hypothetical protein